MSTTPDGDGGGAGRTPAEGASDWIWETGTDHSFSFVSRRFGETSGLAWEQVIGRSVHDLVELGFDAAEMAKMLVLVEARAPIPDTIVRVNLSSGVARFWRVNGRPLYDPSTGAYAGYRGTGADVTATLAREAELTAALRRAEAAEREALRARQILADAIEAIPEGFVLHDAEDRLVLCNRRFAEIYELAEEQMRPGIRLEDSLRQMFQTSRYFADGQDPEAWVSERLRRHRELDGKPVLQQLTDGRWLHIQERRTSDGGTVGIRVDVTEARRQEALERERERRDAELRAARSMQASLLPSARLRTEIIAKTGLDIASRSASCTELGGDLWGMADLDRGRVGVYTLDVAGHGAAAALNTFRVHTLIHELGAWRGEPDRFLLELNMRLAELLPPGAFATMFYAVVDPAWNSITYAAAGAPSPVIRCGAGMPLTPLDGSGLPLGISVRAEYRSQQVKFRPGGMFFLYSDILIDHMDGHGNRAGEEGAFAMIERCAAEATAEEAVARLCAPFLGEPFLGEPHKALSDDLTVVCIRRP